MGIAGRRAAQRMKKNRKEEHQARLHAKDKYAPILSTRPIRQVNGCFAVALLPMHRLSYPFFLVSSLPHIHTHSISLLSAQAKIKAAVCCNALTIVPLLYLRSIECSQQRLIRFLPPCHTMLKLNPECKEAPLSVARHLL